MSLCCLKLIWTSKKFKFNCRFEFRIRVKMEFAFNFNFCIVVAHDWMPTCYFSLITDFCTLSSSPLWAQCISTCSATFLLKNDCETPRLELESWEISHVERLCSDMYLAVRISYIDAFHVQCEDTASMHSKLSSKYEWYTTMKICSYSAFSCWTLRLLVMCFAI